MSIKDYENFLEEYCLLFIDKECMENIYSISKILHNYIWKYDLELCLFYKDKQLTSKCKFQIFSDDFELLSELGFFLWIKENELFKKNIPFKWVQFVLDKFGNIIEYSLSYVQYTMDNIRDISYKKVAHSWYEERVYFHRFPQNYINNIPVARLLDYFNVIDIISFKKNFFGNVRETYYFLLQKWKDYRNDVEKKFNIEIPEILHKNCVSCWAICVDKQEHQKKEYKKFSLYFWTYWL